MTDIIGTENADRLEGTPGNDTIKALGGNDIIIGSSGTDTVDGGDGNDTIDFSSVSGGAITLTNTGQGISRGFNRFGPPSPNALSTGLTSVETIIGNPNEKNTIADFSRYTPAGNMDVDLSAERLTFTSAANGNVSTYTVKNFANINAVNGTNRMKGNDLDNFISGGNGRTEIIGSKGNDYLRGGVRGSIDYSELGTAIKLGFVPDNKDINKPFTYFEVDKGSFGKDTITTEAGKIIGANSQVNTIDVSNLDPGNSLDLNLINNSLALNLAKGGTEKLEVNNFTNAVGTKGNDTIVGANNGGKLTGGGGSDTVTGGSGNDTIAGAGAGARGVGEVDTLTGGGGKDKFVLGDRNGGYYVGNGASDYALITDFNLFQDSISIGSLKDYSVAASGNNTIDLYAGKDASTCDLIAKIQLSSPLSIQAKTATKGMMGANSLNSIEPLSAGLNIISGDNTAETII